MRLRGVALSESPERRRVASDERVARAGDDMIEVPHGTAYDWWNAGDGVAHVGLEVEATAAAPGRWARARVA